MFKITAVYVKTKNTCRVLTTSIPLSSFLSLPKFCAAITNTDTNTTLYVDVQNILQEQIMPKSLSEMTWADLESIMTESWFISYSIEGYGCVPGTKLPKNGIVTRNPIKEEQFSITYCDRNHPKDRGRPRIKWRCKDLVVSQIGSTNPCDFSNCLAVVGGYLCETAVFEDELYLLNAAPSLYHADEEYQPGVLLLDTTDIGGLDIVKFSDCTVNYLNRYESNVLGSDVEITLPENVSFDTHSIILVIAGVLYTFEKYDKIGKRTIRIHPGKFPILVSLQHAALLRNKFRNVSEAETDLLTYFTQTMMSPTCEDAFICCIKNPTINVLEGLAVPFANYTSFFSSMTGGILQNAANGMILPYVTTKYDSTYEHHISLPMPLVTSDTVPSTPGATGSITESKLSRAYDTLMDSRITPAYRYFQLMG